MSHLTAWACIMHTHTHALPCSSGELYECVARQRIRYIISNKVQWIRWCALTHCKLHACSLISITIPLHSDMYMYVYVHVGTYMYMYTLHVYNTMLCICNVYMCIYMYMQYCTCVYVCIYTCTCTCTCIYMYACV